MGQAGDRYARESHFPTAQADIPSPDKTAYQIPSLSRFYVVPAATDAAPSPRPQAVAATLLSALALSSIVTFSITPVNSKGNL
jgi:hypothetical protein